jgi:hypothetical protein
MPLFAMKQANIETKLVKRAPGSCLVADFRESVPPVVWQLDLTKNPGVTVAVRGRDDDWTLGLVEPKGEFTVVARFDNRDDAEDAYAAVQKALIHGRLGSQHSFWHWILLFLIAVVVVMAVQLGVSALFGLSHDRAMDSTKSSGQQLGVPVPADDVLKAPVE